MSWRSLNQKLKRNTLIVLASAVFTAWVWQVNEATWLLGLSVAPLLVALFQAKSNRTSWWLCTLYFAVLDAWVLHWVFTANFGLKGWVLATVGMLLFVLMQSVAMWLPMYAARRWNQPVLLLGVAPTMALFAWLQSTASLGFPWLNLSYQLADSAMEIHALTRFGLLATEALFWMMNAALALLIVKLIRSSGWTSIGGAMSVMAGIALTLLWPFDHKQLNFNEEVVLAIPTYDPYQWDDQMLYRHSRHVLSAIAYAGQINASLVVFPEGYLKDFGDHPIYSNDLLLNPAIRDLHNACKEKKVGLVIGAIAKRVYEQSESPSEIAIVEVEGRYSEKQNLIVYIDVDGNIQHRAKSHLVPFMEAAAGSSLGLSTEFLRIGINRAGVSYASGEPPRHLEWSGRGLIALNCFESLFPAEWSQAIMAGDAMVVVANEGWTNEAMVKQHARMDRAMAKAMRTQLIRSVSIGPDFEFNKEELASIAAKAVRGQEGVQVVATEFGALVCIK